MFFADRVLEFYRSLKIREKLPSGIHVLNPYKDQTVFRLCEQFYRKYYNDTGERMMIIGINPGRFGAGLTGIPFADPVKLQEICGIENTLPKKAELSADFIHAMIQSYGGADSFFNKFYFNSVSPLGFTCNGKNLNYYDRPDLMVALQKFIQGSLETQLGFGVNSSIAFCLGEGDNFRYLSRLNEKMKYFGKIIPLSHPRFIMQYRRRSVQKYIETYIRELRGAPAAVV